MYRETVHYRQQCAACKGEILIVGYGVFRKHNFPRSKDVCPGSRRVPQFVTSAFTALDSRKRPVRAGDTVTFGGDTYIVEKVCWDHPRDINPGAAWLNFENGSLRASRVTVVQTSA